MATGNLQLIRLLILSLCVLAISCSKKNGDCGGGKSVDVQSLIKLRTSLNAGNGPDGFLVVPNPIDATRQPFATATDEQSLSAGSLFELSSLSNPRFLENDFLRVRIKGIDDAKSTLASPTSDGAFRYKIEDVHYSEVMAYHSVSTMIRYVEALGFPVVKSRPLFVMVRSQSEDPNEVNAYYDHHYLDPSSPRTMKLFGDTKFAPGMDAEMYRHEFGHLFNESASREVGIDYAGDNGARFTQAAALHECLADHLAQSFGNKPEIGRWIARNFNEKRAGEPLRTAADPGNKKQQYREVSINDGTGQNPERYRMAEWCTRVLWAVRNKFLSDDKKAGAIYSERLVFSALSLLKQDTSMSQFRQALISADEKLYCGDHVDTIEQEFKDRGFDEEPPKLGTKLSVKATPVGVFQDKQGNLIGGNVSAGSAVAFQISVRNTSNETARNVRVQLESLDNRLSATTYLTGLGDIAPKGGVTIGDGGLPLDFGVFGDLAKNADRGQRVRYRINVLSENGDRVSVEGEM